jgi:hypothetical protein
MKYEPLDRDLTLGDALADAAGESVDARVNWAELRRAIGAGAAAELTRRRARRRSRLAIPTSLAAGIALFVLIAGVPYPTTAPTLTTASIARHQPIDDLLDANVSDVQFRAMVSGASDTDELLAIAAQDDRP